MMNMSKAFKEGLLAGGLALIIFGPVTGMLLDGFELSFALKRPFVLAGLVFLGRVLFSLLWDSEVGQRLKAHWKASNQHHTIVAKGEPRLKKRLIGLIVLSVVLPFILSKYWLTVAILTLIYILLGLGLNIVVGLAGLLDLGFVAFYAVGAYSYALGVEYLHLGFWTALPFAAFLAACFGALLAFPVLRMHGDYLAIVTLGFGEIIRLVLNNWASVTKGPNGIFAPYPTFFGLEFTKRAKQGGTPFHEFFNLEYSSIYRYIFIYMVLILVVWVMIKFVSRLQKMPLGRAWEALREDEIACRSLGINHVTTKLSAFSLGAMVGSLGGVFFAAYQGFINPSSFTFIESALILAIVVLGGMGSVTGVVCAAIVLTLMPELLREFSQFRMLAFGGLMVMMMILRPRGLVKVVRAFYSRPKKVGAHG